MLVTYKKVYVTNITQPGEVLGAVEEAFVGEVGTRRAAALSASVLGQHPELADEWSARSALASLVIGAPSL